MQSRNLVIVSAVVAVISGGTFAAEAPSQDVINNARQETQIWTTYTLNPHLRNEDLTVSVRNGKATLFGEVEESTSKDLATQIARGVRGIEEVDNQMVVRGDHLAPVRSSARSFAEIVDDATIAATVKSKLVWSQHLDGLATAVDTKWGVVTLEGSADSTAAKDFAGRLALNTRGVVSVDNRLVVVDHKAPNAATRSTRSSAGPERTIADSWITTKVKSTFMYSDNVDGSNIEVSTNSGVVTLTGKVAGGAERALAIEFAQNVRGVKSVQSDGLMTAKAI